MKPDTSAGELPPGSPGEGLALGNSGALDGVRILDMTSVVMGPYATQMQRHGLGYAPATIALSVTRRSVRSRSRA